MTDDDHPCLEHLQIPFSKYYLQSDPICRKIVPQAPRVFFRRTRNIRDLLVSSDIRTSDSNRQRPQPNSPLICASLGSSS